ncbi:ArsR family transcriptional regulator [Candidatus Woesearchaeota archaeon]|nr:ArsR family transcriptional regulator [Candidatus Woesearchaeota archaeon]
MGEKANEIIGSIKKSLSNSPKSISEISKEAEINWRTAEQYLELLKKLGLVIETEIKNTRTFLLRDKDNYFDLPIKEKDQKVISAIYYQTKKFCNESYRKDPTKTQAYKIIWNVNRKLNLGLPIGWYRYGPCCVQIYRGDEQDFKLDSRISRSVKESTEEYCSMDSSSLQNKIYVDEKKDLYLAKKKLIEMADAGNKEDLNNILMDLIKFAPKETVEVVTDFARATLLLGWEKTQECFNESVWKYVAMVIFKDSLEFYYKNGLNQYFNKRIEEVKREAQLQILNLVKNRPK